MVNLSSSRPRSQRRAGARFVRRRRRAACNPGKITSSPSSSKEQTSAVQGRRGGKARQEATTGRCRLPPLFAVEASVPVVAGQASACLVTGPAAQRRRHGQWSFFLLLKQYQSSKAGIGCWTDVDSAVYMSRLASLSRHARCRLVCLSKARDSVGTGIVGPMSGSWEQRL